MLDPTSIETARHFVNEVRPPPGRVLLCAVTGAHLYGFPSPDSDLDLKGVHLAPTIELLGLGRPPDTHDVTEVHRGVECDLTTHEAGFALGHLLKGNGNLLERVASPLQLFATPALDELRRLLPRLVTRRVHGHYAGFFRQTCRFFDRESRAKTLLYSVRVALTGIHLLKTGEIQAHLPTLADQYGFPEAHDVIALKREGHESTPLTPSAAAPLRRRWPELEQALSEAQEATTLPASAEGRDEVEDWLVALRRAELV